MKRGGSPVPSSEIELVVRRDPKFELPAQDIFEHADEDLDDVSLNWKVTNRFALDGPLTLSWKSKSPAVFAQPKQEDTRIVSVHPPSHMRSG